MFESVTVSAVIYNSP